MCLVGNRYVRQETYQCFIQGKGSHEVLTGLRPGELYSKKKKYMARKLMIENCDRTCTVFGESVNTERNVGHNSRHLRVS